jgi:hypothetical protein
MPVHIWSESRTKYRWVVGVPAESPRALAVVVLLDEEGHRR